MQVCQFPSASRRARTKWRSVASVPLHYHVEQRKFLRVKSLQLMGNQVHLSDCYFCETIVVTMVQADRIINIRLVSCLTKGPYYLVSLCSESCSAACPDRLWSGR